MKKLLLYFIGAAIALASCAKTEPAEVVAGQEENSHQHGNQNEGTGILNISISPKDVPGSKVTSAYTGTSEYETSVNRVQILVFDESDEMESYKNLGTAKTVKLSVKTGSKKVYAVINVSDDLSSIKKISDLEGKAVDLSANSTTPSGGFVMVGKNTCVVGKSEVSCSVEVSRLAARVVLAKVTNNLPQSYGALIIKRVYLSNVVGNQNLAGNASPSKWYNKQGRMDESPQVKGHIIDGSTYTASCPTLTYKDAKNKSLANGTGSEDLNWCFYSYANGNATPPGEFSTSFNGSRSILTVVAGIEGKDYFYPVVLDKANIERNTTCTVGLTISGKGSSDPNLPVEKGAVSISVTISPWEQGVTYDETI